MGESGKRIKVAFDGQLFLKGNKTGIAWGADNVIREIAKDPDFECSLNYLTKGCSEEQINSMKSYEADGIRLHPVQSMKNRYFVMLWGLLHYPYKKLFGTEAQITQFFNFVLPTGIEGKKVTIVHDMSYLAYPEHVRTKTKIWLRLLLRGSVKRADYVVTVSEFTKKELIKYLGVPEEKIRVMYQGVDLKLYRDDYSKAEIDRVKRKYNISNDYIFYLGTIEPRKNLQRLIEAYGLMIKRYLEESMSRAETGESEDELLEKFPDLILAGGKGWLCDDIYKAAEAAEIHGKVKFLGYVEEKDSPLLMAGAEYFCFPSVYEGFGMPPIEAMACGTPVFASDRASLPEVLGEHAVYADPFSKEEMAEKMYELHRNTELREKLKSGCRKFAERYDWKNSAETLKDIYRELAD